MIRHCALFLLLAAPSPLAGAQTSPAQVPSVLLRGFIHDQKPIWLFPLHAGKHWKAVLPLAVTTATLIALDPHDTPWFRRTTRFHEFNEDFSSINTAVAESLFPVGLYLSGLERHSSYSERSAVLAGEAFIDSELVAEVLKNIDRRERPRQIPPYGDFTHTWFKQSGFPADGSFPSGHAIGAFAIAAVISARYSHHRWVPWLAYGLASLIGGSRVPVQAHFPSDVFAGGALGYSIAHFVVLRP